MRSFTCVLYCGFYSFALISRDAPADQLMCSPLHISFSFLSSHLFLSL